jgi:hypothetical protein
LRLPKEDKMKRRNMDVFRLSPLRPLTWRWRYAERIVERGKRPRRDSFDTPTALAVDYLRAEANHNRQAHPRYAQLRAAIELHQAGGDISHLIQARILTGEPATAIAAVTGISAPVIDLYEQLFFHVSDRLNATDWVTHQAIRQGEWNPSSPSRAVVLRQLAYFGGPLVLDTVTPLLVGIDVKTQVTERAEPEEARKLVALLLTPDERASNWGLMALHPMLASSRAGKIPPLKQCSPLKQLLAGLGGANIECVAHRERHHGVGKTPQSDLPLPIGARGQQGPQGVPGVGAASPAGRRGGQQAATGTATPNRAGGSGPDACGGGCSGSPLPRKHGPAADRSSAAGHRAATPEPTPMEAVA